MISSIGSQIQAYSATNFVSNRPVGKVSNQVATIDSVNISEAARTMAQHASGGKIKIPAVGGSGPIRIEDLKAETKESLAVFHKDLRRLFAENGIDTSQEINISANSSGKVVVTNDHPDKEKIEQIFANDSELANRYRGISGNMALIKAVEEASAFQKEYAINPEAAVAKYSYLFDENRNNDPYLNINGDRFSFEYRG